MVSNNKIRFNGFTLIEVLVSVVVLSIGILGTLNLQSRALMDNQDAYLRTQAILLAYDMSDRLRANAGFWKATVAGDSVNTAFQQGEEANPAPHCSAHPSIIPSNCSGNEMATYDINRWLSNIDDILPNGTATITLAEDLNTSSSTKNTLQLEITWNKMNVASLNTQSFYSLNIRL